MSAPAQTRPVPAASVAGQPPGGIGRTASAAGRHDSSVCGAIPQHGRDCAASEMTARAKAAGKVISSPNLTLRDVAANDVIRRVMRSLDYVPPLTAGESQNVARIARDILDRRARIEARKATGGQ